MSKRVVFCDLASNQNTNSTFCPISDFLYVDIFCHARICPPVIQAIWVIKYFCTFQIRVCVWTTVPLTMVLLWLTSESTSDLITVHGICFYCSQLVIVSIFLRVINFTGSWAIKIGTMKNAGPAINKYSLEIFAKWERPMFFPLKLLLICGQSIIFWP